MRYDETSGAEISPTLTGPSRREFRSFVPISANLLSSESVGLRRCGPGREREDWLRYLHTEVTRLGGEVDLDDILRRVDDLRDGFSRGLKGTRAERPGCKSSAGGVVLPRNSRFATEGVTLAWFPLKSPGEDSCGHARAVCYRAL